MDSSRKAAIIVGELFIIATAATMILIILRYGTRTPSDTSLPYRGTPAGVLAYYLMGMTLGLVTWGYFCGAIARSLTRSIIGLQRIFLWLIRLQLMFLWFGPLILYSDALSPGIISISKLPLVFFIYYIVFAFIGYAYYAFTRRRASKA